MYIYIYLVPKSISIESMICNQVGNNQGNDNQVDNNQVDDNQVDDNQVDEIQVDENQVEYYQVEYKKSSQALTSTRSMPIDQDMATVVQ